MWNGSQLHKNKYRKVYNEKKNKRKLMSTAGTLIR